MDFEAYCVNKKIDFHKFKEDDTLRFQQWESEFLQIHPNSFTSQKLFYINEVRRRYPLETKPLKDESMLNIEIKKPTSETLIENDLKETQEKSTLEPAKPKKPLIKPIIKSENSDNVETSLNQNASIEKKPIAKPVMKPIIKKTE